jgi:hypothetical protein
MERIRLIVVKDGRESAGARMLDPGAVIAARDYDPDRDAIVVHLRTDGVPASPEVIAADAWDCERDGHRWEGVQSCLECGEFYRR